MTSAQQTGDPAVAEALRQADSIARARAHVVLVAPRADGGALEVNGTTVGQLPRTEPFVVEAGALRVRVLREGCAPWELVRTFTGGEEMRDEVTCERARPIVVPPQPLPQPRTAQRTVGWTLVGVGAALGVAGAVFWGLSYDTMQSLESYCDRADWHADAVCQAASGHVEGDPPATQGDPCNGPRTASLDDLCGRNNLQRFSAFALGVAGVVTMATGIVLVVTAPRRRTVTPTAWVQLDGGGLLLQGNF